MSDRQRRLTAKQVIRILKKRGFVQISQRGSHRKFRSPEGRQVIVADHGNKQIPIGTLKSIIEGSGISSDDFS